MRRRRWVKWALAAYFVAFLLFLYGPMIVMAVLSFQGPQGGISFPMRGFSLHWWDQLVDGPRADTIRETAGRSLRLGLISGAIVAFLALTLSMAYRRRFRGDNAVFYLIMLALMTPGILLSLGTALYWQFLGEPTSLWRTVVGTHVVWGLPFGFLVMVAVWNRYSNSVEEASRDLGAGAFRTFREVTLPLIWTGLLGAFLFGFTLSWNDYDRTALLAGGENTLPLQIFALTIGSVIRPDLYALGTATTLVSLLAVGILLVVAGVLRRRRGRPVAEATVEEEMGLLESDLPEGELAGSGGR
ncbi:MAG TPA: ABC transporter permease [Gaiellaceae bacterium]|nr:ABC transporter permease [Gaiellaceae bacterium]